MKMKLRIIGSLAIAAVSTLILGSCGGDPDSPGLEYMPDMYRSPAVEPYVDYGHIKERENPELKTRLSAMTPPNGTIPYYGTDSAEVYLMLPYKHKANDEFRETHGMYGEGFLRKASTRTNWLQQTRTHWHCQQNLIHWHTKPSGKELRSYS